MACGIGKVMLPERSRTNRYLPFVTLGRGFKSHESIPARGLLWERNKDRHWAAYLRICGVWELRVELMISRRHYERQYQDGTLHLLFTSSLVYSSNALLYLDSHRA